jgi:uncharacterized membrane protein (UPF0136 family)
MVFVVYALFLVAGGVMGWVKASSLMSLYAGVGSGLLLLILSHFIYRKQRWAIIAASILVAMLALFFGIRFVKTGNFLPGGLMALLGGVTLISSRLWKLEGETHTR